MTAKEIIETFSKKDPNEIFIFAWYEASEFVDEADGITQKDWDDKAPSYKLEWDCAEHDCIYEYLMP